MKIIEEKTLKMIMIYIEYCEVKIDGEWGSCRTLSELIRDDMMPDTYWEVVKTLYPSITKEERYQQVKDEEDLGSLEYKLIKKL